ncbi:MAG: sugar ABC transporter ATP-binding protein [Phycisphaerae bacterium]|nr:sugar ABC transporter ATP-binding protein [Phycisphaerae bacterium]
MTALSMRGVRKRFAATVALAGVDLEVAAGEIHALLGENGAGKSTLMKILAGAITPDAGVISLNGTTYAPRDPIAGRDAGVAMIYQELTLAPHLSVVENIRLAREKTITRADATAALRALGLTNSVNTLVKNLGPGERQIVEIARAIAADARVIVLDEPTSSIGPMEASRVFDAMRRLRDLGRAVIFISHHLDEVRAVAERFTVLRDGASVGTGRIAETSDDALIALMAGRPLGQLFPVRTWAAGGVVLKIDALAGDSLPRDASLELRRGEIFGIAGLIGAGRTELLRTIFGLDAVRAGHVRVGAWSSSTAQPYLNLRHGVGMLSEDRKNEGLAQRLPIATNLLLSSLNRHARHGVVDDRTLARASEPWLARLGIKAASPLRLVSELSGGNQQKVAIARLLAHDVDVMLLDEPTRGIDVGSKAEIYRLLASLASQGKAIVMVSSVATELLGLCDRIAVMHRGVLGAARAADAWTEESIVHAASLGTAKDVA